jgi:hypothetical protein
LKEPFRNHTVLCCELIDWVCERQIPGDFTMDSYFTCAEILKDRQFGQRQRRCPGPVVRPPNMQP